MSFGRKSPNTCFIKYDADEEFQAIQLTGIKRERITDVSAQNDKLPRQYQAIKLPILAAKKKNIFLTCMYVKLVSHQQNFKSTIRHNLHNKTKLAYCLKQMFWSMTVPLALIMNRIHKGRAMFSYAPVICIHASPTYGDGRG